MSPRIASLTVERFRTLREITIGGLGQVNLITGRNNTGKSSLLEALRILVSSASPEVVRSILGEREEGLVDAEQPRGSDTMDRLFPLSSLFSGFPLLSARPGPIAISAEGDPRPMRLTLAVDWFQVQASGDMKPLGLGQRVSGSETLQRSVWPVLPAFVLTVDGQEHVFPLTYYGVGESGGLVDAMRYAYWFGNMPRTAEAVGGESIPCVYVGPCSGDQTAKLGVLWDNIALTDRESDVIAGLQMIDPTIVAVSMVGGEGLPPQSGERGMRSRRTAIVRASSLPRPVPLRTFGDGLNRLFAILLSLVNAKDGLLLIDEFENGMHHSVQHDAWRAIFRLASSLNIQVFAASHSWDAVEAFQRAAAESPREGVLVRLTRKGEHIVPTLYSEDDLRVATRERIEVR